MFIPGRLNSGCRKRIHIQLGERINQTTLNIWLNASASFYLFRIGYEAGQNLIFQGEGRKGIIIIKKEKKGKGKIPFYKEDGKKIAEKLFNLASKVLSRGGIRTLIATPFRFKGLRIRQLGKKVEKRGSLSLIPVSVY